MAASAPYARHAGESLLHHSHGLAGRAHRRPELDDKSLQVPQIARTRPAGAGRGRQASSPAINPICSNTASSSPYCRSAQIRSTVKLGDRDTVQRDPEMPVGLQYRCGRRREWSGAGVRHLGESTRRRRDRHPRRAGRRPNRRRRTPASRSSDRLDQLRAHEDVEEGRGPRLDVVGGEQTRQLLEVAGDSGTQRAAPGRALLRPTRRSRHPRPAASPLAVSNSGRRSTHRHGRGLD